MREQPHQRLPLICFAWKINRLYQVLELQKSQSAKKGSVVTPTVPGTKCSREEGACSGGFGCFIWGRVVFVFVFLSSTRQIRPSSETPRANQPFPTSSSHLPSASSLRCHLPTLPVADAGGWWGHSGKAWPPNSAASEGTVERQEDVCACGRRTGEAGIPTKPPPCLSSLPKGEVGPGPQRGKFRGAWRDFSSSHSFWQQDGPRRWIFVASLLKKPHGNFTSGINGWVLEKRE